MKPNKINHKSSSSNQVTIVTKAPPGTSFSFQYLSFDNEKFVIEGCDVGYFSKMLNRLKDISRMSPDELRNDKSKSLRCHSIDWDGTSEKAGFAHLNSQLQGVQPWQFEITSNKHGRIHGMFLENIFFIVWFDPHHKLYS